MAEYLLRVAEQHAQALEALLGGPLCVAQLKGPGGVPVAGLDAVTEQESDGIRVRLRTGAPLYHARGPEPLHEIDVTPMTETERTAVKDPLLSAVERLIMLYRCLLDDPAPARAMLVIELGKVRTHLDAAQALGAGIAVPGG